MMALNTEFTPRFYRLTAVSLLFLLVSRLIAMAIIPLNDSTEARYGEIARIMLETGNWVTPMHQYGEPFWAKPPLSTWLSALSMKWFGVSAFAARLPSLLLSIGVLWLVWCLGKSRQGKGFATISVLILAGTFYFLLNAGAVMTDPALLFCTTLILTSFWMALVYQRKLWSYLFFIGLGLGLLAKGPIAWVLTGTPILIWTIWKKQWLSVWQRFPWVFGSVLTVGIALPWYYLAEKHTPGFLNYFILGEHVYRFLKPGWAGDKYGFAHVAPYGMVWGYALMATLPWGILVAGHFLKRERLAPTQLDSMGWQSYLWLCTTIPLVFFTFARNIIYPYVFPILPTLALLIAEYVMRMNVTVRQRLPWIAMSSGLVFLSVVLIFLIKPEWVGKSQDRTIAVWQAQHPSPGARLLYWQTSLEYSASFYARGLVRATFNAAELARWLSEPGVHYVVTDTRLPHPLPEELLNQLVLVDSLKILKRDVRLYRSRQSN